MLNAAWALFLAGATADILFTLGAVSKTYQFHRAGVKFSAATTDSVDTELSQSFPFQAIYNATDLSSLTVTRTP